MDRCIPHENEVRRPTARILITPAMVEAALQELHEVGLSDPAYLVRSIYMAMEFERLDALGKL